ncbi:hypothetical protein KAR91_62070 [Candidatus Pacearchaeota archaeon]|nr:hypothetical protein [Candidatus Pacearchaeota archaeon]
MEIIEETTPTELVVIEGQAVPGQEEAESTEEYQAVDLDERQKSHDVCLDLCDDIRDVLLQIQREITGLFNAPRLRAVEHRYKLMGIYNNMEKLYAQIAAKK